MFPKPGKQRKIVQVPIYVIHKIQTKKKLEDRISQLKEIRARVPQGSVLGLVLYTTIPPPEAYFGGTYLTQRKNTVRAI